MEKGGDYDEAHLIDLVEGRQAAESILNRADEALGKEARVEAVSELQGRVEDWKGHKIDNFGDLLLYGSYTVLKGEGAKEVEREVSKCFTPLNARSCGFVQSCTEYALPLAIYCTTITLEYTRRCSKCAHFAAEPGYRAPWYSQI